MNDCPDPALAPAPFLRELPSLRALIAARDWAATPLGAREGWPQHLRGAVDAVLALHFPACLLWGPDLIQVYNDGVAALIGIRHPEVLGRPLGETWPGTRDALGAVLARVRAGETVLVEDRLLRLKTLGAPLDRSFTLSYGPLHDPEGGVAGVLVTGTETIRSVEARLAAREAELARVQRIGRVGGLEVDLRQGFRNRRSPEYLALHGLRPEDAEESHENWVARIHPEDRERTERAFKDAVRRGAREYRAEYRIVRPSDGRTRWIAAVAEIERGADGRAVRLVGAHTDVTERREAEEALRRLNETLESEIAQRTEERDRVWQLSQDIFAVAGFDGRLRRINPAWTRLLGFPQEELLARPFHELIHPDDLAAAGAVVEALRRGEAVPRFEDRLRHADGGWRWISWTAVPEGDEFYAVGRDVTEAREREEQLRQALKMEAVGQLTGGIAHDFNNLLTGIVGSLDLLQTRLAQGRTEALPRYADAAMSSARRAAALTHRLLAFARRQPLSPRPVEMGPLVLSMADLIQRTLGESIEVGLDLAPDLWPVLCDGNQLETALLNLVINARDAMPEGGRLTIATANLPEAGRAALSVTDTGVGMTAEVTAKVFDPFFTTKPIGEGTGLGLSMLYGFVTQSGGEVRLASAPGEGTRVTIELPRHLGAPAEKPPAPAASPRAAARETVLVVEDERVVRELVVEVLEDLGYRALSAADAGEALALLNGDVALDLLVTDVGLPGMNGRQLADLAREGRPGLRVLFTTGYARGAARPDFLAPGMAMITKPFEVEALARKVREMIDGAA